MGVYQPPRPTYGTEGAGFDANRPPRRGRRPPPGGQNQGQPGSRPPRRGGDAGRFGNSAGYENRGRPQRPGGAGQDRRPPTPYGLPPRGDEQPSRFDDRALPRDDIGNRIGNDPRPGGGGPRRRRRPPPR